MDFFKGIETEEGNDDCQGTYYQKYFSPENIEIEKPKSRKKKSQEVLSGWENFIKKKSQSNKPAKKKTKLDHLLDNENSRYRRKFKQKSLMLNRVNSIKLLKKRRLKNQTESPSSQYRNSDIEIERYRKFTQKSEKTQNILTPKPIKIIFEKLEGYNTYRRVDVEMKKKAEKRRTALPIACIKHRNILLAKKQEKVKKKLDHFLKEDFKRNNKSHSTSKFSEDYISDYQYLKSQKFDFANLRSTIQKFKALEKKKQAKKEMLMDMNANNSQRKGRSRRRVKKKIKGKKALQDGLNFLERYSKVLNPKKRRDLKKSMSLTKGIKFNHGRSQSLGKSKQTQHSKLVINRAALRVSKNLGGSFKKKKDGKLNFSEIQAFRNLYRKNKGVRGLKTTSFSGVDIGKDSRRIDVIRLELKDVNERNGNIHLY